MRVVIAGLGSIGRKHLDAFRAVRPGCEYALWRSGTRNPSEIEGLAELHSAAEVGQFEPDLVLVCTPTSRHAATVAELEPLATALFVEKPLAHTPEDLRAIVAQVEASGRPFFHGAVLRHHPLLARTRELLADQAVGAPLTYALHCGSWLPDWRPGRDYREVYSARADLGGGVATDLIHEFDYADWLFGPAASIEGVRAQLSNLELDVDDACLALLAHESGVIGQVQLSYFRALPRRDFEISCSAGLLRGDLLAGTLEIVRGHGAAAERSEELHAATGDELMQRQAAAVLDALEQGVGGDDVRAVAELTERVLSIPFMAGARR